jgi:hypothetical protein
LKSKRSEDGHSGYSINSEEGIIKMDDGTTIERKKRTDKSDYKSIKDGNGNDIASPESFLKDIFTPLQLEPVEFLSMTEQEQNRILLNLIKFDKDKKQFITEKFGEEMEKTISEKLSQLLEKMSIYVGVNKILDIVSKKNKKAEFREFKPLLLKMLESFGSQTHLLRSIRTYLIHICQDDQDVYLQINNQGKDVDFGDKCEYCQNYFNRTLKDREKVLAFKCDHIEHEDCTFKSRESYGNDRVCPICLKNEIEEAVTCGPDDPRSKLSFEKFIQNNNNNNQSNKNYLNKKRTDLNLFSYSRGFNKMRAIDNYNEEKRNLFYYDSATSCRDKYRKKVFDDY